MDESDSGGSVAQDSASEFEYEEQDSDVEIGSDGVDDNRDDQMVIEPPEVRKAPYAIMNRSELKDRQHRCIMDASELLEVSSEESFVLLRVHSWCLSRLQEAWFANEGKVRELCGLPPVSSAGGASASGSPCPSLKDEGASMCCICMAERVGVASSIFAGASSFARRFLGARFLEHRRASEADPAGRAGPPPQVREDAAFRGPGAARGCAKTRARREVRRRVTRVGFPRAHPEEKPHMLSLGCGHGFCEDCWREYLHVQVNDGRSAVLTRCPQHKCSQIVLSDIFRTLCDEARRAKYDEWHLRTFVDDNPSVKWCSNPNGCSNACEYAGVDMCDIRCSCEYVWCWACGEEAHRPADCSTVNMWNVKNSAESENISWIRANTKKCPKCHKPIEKNQGCNHMSCSKAGGCGHEFCWLCLGDWATHGTSRKRRARRGAAAGGFEEKDGAGGTREGGTRMLTREGGVEGGTRDEGGRVGECLQPRASRVLQGSPSD
ncbi:unnamed protein product [Prorocentrum cordatum]|uniref:RBR-type E3 ubiquitin transferase n=1 Tax=Prorocentrum cordatum TaxID=2364126 RepID=A0ABN9QDF2_9DINO|nr:unnamed protein product [Polarella glacialis]